MTDGPFAVRVPRDVLRVSGRDAASYLQGQVSQDVVALAVGSYGWSFVLQPQGKVDAWFRVTRTADDAFVLDLDGGWGETLTRRLERFKLRVAVDISTLDWQCVAVRGTDAERTAGVEIAVPVDWGDVAGVDLLGPAVAVPTGVEERGIDAYEAWRVAAGMPAMGAELDERTIPAEAGVVERSVSFTKGCYTGQELVARVDSRGSRTPRKLRLVVLDGPGAAPGDDLVVGDTTAGALTSVAGSNALAYVRREVEPPAAATVRSATGVEIAARVEPLPGSSA